MILANCSNKFTSVCTGHCDTCINSPLLGKMAVDVMKNLESSYNKGYDDGQKAMAKRLLKLWFDDMFCAGECVDHIEKLAKEMGVKIDVF